jgi:hypothetical protein
MSLWIVLHTGMLVLVLMTNAVVLLIIYSEPAATGARRSPRGGWCYGHSMVHQLLLPIMGQRAARLQCSTVCVLQACMHLAT